jgi:hypothetical protein
MPVGRMKRIRKALEPGNRLFRGVEPRELILIIHIRR